MKLYVAVSATAWIPVNIYVVMLINFFLSGTLLVISFYRNQERIAESIRGGILGQLGQHDNGGK